MIESTLERWHAVVEHRDPSLLDELLADDVVFWSPIVFRPQEGRELTSMYLAGALATLGADGTGFRYTKQVAAGDTAVLEFETTLGDVAVNGVDIIRVDAEGRIVEFRVMIRPLRAVNAVHQAMGDALAAMSSDGST